MIKVITYGTFDLLHFGHKRILERAKELGDYLIVGITSDEFDRTRGKINNQQTLIQRIEAVKALNIADEIVVEEYDGQKIDDIKKYNVDIFTLGSDWIGMFDYLSEYCKVIYLERTEGISSTSIRSNNNKINIGIIGEFNNFLTSISKFIKESKFVNGISIHYAYLLSNERLDDYPELEFKADFEDFLKNVDSVYIAALPEQHYSIIKTLLDNNKHVLCESPISLKKQDTIELFEYAKNKKLVLMEGIKTFYSTAYMRLLLAVKTGIIGKVVSVDSTCTSLKNFKNYNFQDFISNWNTICEWGPIALLPIFQILGTEYVKTDMFTKLNIKNKKFDEFTKIDFLFKSAVASAKISKAVKSEGELIISGTKGYIYVPSPWWKTEYFEVRYENSSNNRRFFYKLNGEGIRNEISSFSRMIEFQNYNSLIDEKLSIAISGIIENFYNGNFFEFE